MKSKDFLLVVAAVAIGATIANLIALKIAADQVQAKVDSSGLLKNPATSLLGMFSQPR